MASSSVSVEVSDMVDIVHPNITMSIGKSEVCPLCLVDFVSDKNIVVPDCGHSMHISCFCSLISYNLRDCSVCKKPIGNNSALCASGASSAFRIPTRTGVVDGVIGGRVPTPVPTVRPTPSPAMHGRGGRPVHTVYPELYSDDSHPWG